MLFEKCSELVMEKISIYGFTQDNTKRPTAQKAQFSQACIEFACEAVRRGAALMVIGDSHSRQFPDGLSHFSLAKAVT
jgi:undecaprenyl diphosphate synthase